MLNLTICIDSYTLLVSEFELETRRYRIVDVCLVFADLFISMTVWGWRRRISTSLRSAKFCRYRESALKNGRDVRSSGVCEVRIFWFCFRSMYTGCFECFQESGLGCESEIMTNFESVSGKGRYF